MTVSGPLWSARRRRIRVADLERRGGEDRGLVARRDPEAVEAILDGDRRRGLAEDLGRPLEGALLGVQVEGEVAGRGPLEREHGRKLPVDDFAPSHIEVGHGHDGVRGLARGAVPGARGVRRPVHHPVQHGRRVEGQLDAANGQPDPLRLVVLGEVAHDDRRDRHGHGHDDEQDRRDHECATATAPQELAARDRQHVGERAVHRAAPGPAVPAVAARGVDRGRGSGEAVLIGRRASHPLDEDLLDRWVADLEAGDVLAPGLGLEKDRLRVPAGLHVELGEVHARPGHLDAGEFGQPGELRITGHADPDDPSTGRASDIADRAGDDDAPVIEEGHRLAQLLDHLHLVGAEDEGLALVAQLDEGILEERDVHRVEPHERLVEEQHGRVVQDRRDDLDLLLVALRELLGPALLVLRDPEAGQPMAGSFGRDPARDAVQRREEHELLEHLHPRVEAALLGQVAPGSAGQLGRESCRPRSPSPHRPGGCPG